jgi:4'-phosphopantetheinyl transferase
VCENGRVGLDVEDVDVAVDVDSAARVALADSELAALHARPPGARKSAFLCTWTRKEAVLKAFGVGLGAPLRDLVLSDPGQPPEVLGRPEQLDGRTGLRLTDLLVDEIHPAAVAVAAAAAVGPPGTAGIAGTPGTAGTAGVQEAVDGLRITLRDGSAALAG